MNVSEWICATFLFLAFVPCWIVMLLLTCKYNCHSRKNMMIILHSVSTCCYGDVSNIAWRSLLLPFSLISPLAKKHVNKSCTRKIFSRIRKFRRLWSRKRRQRAYSTDFTRPLVTSIDSHFPWNNLHSHSSFVDFYRFGYFGIFCRYRRIQFILYFIFRKHKL